jgi:hypothetical protein
MVLKTFLDLPFTIHHFLLDVFFLSEGVIVRRSGSASGAAGDQIGAFWRLRINHPMDVGVPRLLHLKTLQV